MRIVCNALPTELQAGTARCFQGIKLGYFQSLLDRGHIPLEAEFYKLQAEGAHVGDFPHLMFSQ